MNHRIVAEIDYGHFVLFSDHEHDHVSLTMAAGKRWEPDILAIAEGLIKPGMAVMDIGANMGTFTVRFAQLVGHRGVVYAFEPQRVVFQQLCGNIFLNVLHNVHAYNYAVAEANKWVELSPIDYHVRPDAGSVRIMDCGSGVFVEAITIDSLELSELDLVKIDVERYEPYVLQGMTETIRRCRPTILFELTTLPLPGFDRFYAVRFLEELNYTVTCINETTFDYLAVPNEV